MTLGEACLVCFARGFTARERALKRAYASSYKRLADWIERTAGGTDDSWKAADAVAGLLSRRSAGLPRLRAAKERLRAAGKPAGVLRDVLTNALSGMLGSPTLLHPDTLLAFGMDGLRTPIEPIGMLASSDDLKLDRFSLSTLAQTVHDSGLVELERARDAFLVLRDVAVRFAAILTRIYSLHLDQLEQLANDDLLGALVGIPATLITRLALGKETFDANLETLRAELPRLHATQRLIDQLSPDLYHCLTMSPTDLATLNEPVFERFRSGIQRYFEAHPEDLPLLTDTTGPGTTNP